MKKNTWKTRLSHVVLKQMCAFSDKKFRKHNHDVEYVQRQRLKTILQQSDITLSLNIKDYEQFCKEINVSRYSDWKIQIENWREHRQALSKSPLVRFQPTSGSSEQIKFIPYTKAFLGELDQAIGPWLSSLYRRAPKLATGTHYWSVSWLPESQRSVLKDDNLNDDSALLGFGKRLLSKFTQTVPQHVAFASNPDDALFATICYLIADEDLAMISVWSPTFALQLLERIQQYTLDIIAVLEQGDWGSRKSALQSLNPPFAPERANQLRDLIQNDQILFEKLWPKLSLISSWDTAGSKQWAQLLQQELPFAQFEGKGLWATEGVVTIPYDGLYPLAYMSHFYEFEYLSGDKQGQVIPSWQLQYGDEVSPIITSGNGLLRYCLDDHLKVTGFFGQVPCFEFQGRRFGVDLVGEKFAPEAAFSILQQISKQDEQAISLLAIDTMQQQKPFYCLLIEASQLPSIDGKALDQYLRAHFHYELARDLGQLAEPQIIYAVDGWDAYKKLVMQDGMIEGNIKPEPLKKVNLHSFQNLQKTLLNH